MSTSYDSTYKEFLPTSSCRFVFHSRVPQRGSATGASQYAESPCPPDVGPGAYDPKLVEPWLVEPERPGSAFASRTTKSKMERPLTAGVNMLGSDMGFASKDKLGLLRSGMPNARGQSWPRGARKPPHFHVPFRPYPSAAGEPRGRSPGLDEFYELDLVQASPSALHGAFTANLNRTSRAYASTFKSKQPARPVASASAGAGFDLGPGAYNIDRSGIKLKDPYRPSSAFVRHSGGKFRGVGGPHGNGGLWPEDDVGAGVGGRRRAAQAR
jgi:hypothetical protein